MSQNPRAPTTRITLRNVDIGTAKILDSLAKAAGKSRNGYVNGLLDRIAIDSAYNPYNRDNALLLLQKTIPLLEQVHQSLDAFNTYFQELKESMEEGDSDV